jgi:hypothetical protein
MIYLTDQSARVWSQNMLRAQQHNQQTPLTPQQLCQLITTDINKAQDSGNGVYKGYCLMSIKYVRALMQHTRDLYEENEHLKCLVAAHNNVPSTSDTPQYLSVSEYAKKYNKAASTIYGYVKNGRVTSTQHIEGGRISIVDQPPRPGKSRKQKRG